jgi:hypothetical protein
MKICAPTALHACLADRNSIKMWSIGGMVLTRESEVLREKSFQCHFVHHISDTDWPRIEPGPEQK